MRGRSIAVSVFSAISVACVCLFIALVTLQNTLLSGDSLKRWLRDSRTYSTTTAIVADAAAEQFSNPVISKDLIRDMVGGVFTADAARASTEQAIDEYYNWLDNAPPKPRLAAGQDDLTGRLATAPVSGTAQTAVNSQTRPPNELSPPEVVGLMKAWITIAPILALLFAALVFMLAADKLLALRRLAGRMVLASLVALAVGLGMMYYGQVAVPGFTPGGQEQAMRQVFVPVINTAVPDIGGKLASISGGVAVMAGLVWIILFAMQQLLRAGRTNQAEYPAEPQPDDPGNPAPSAANP